MKSGSDTLTTLTATDDNNLVDDSSAASSRILISSSQVYRVLWITIVVLLAGNVLAQLTDHQEYLGRRVITRLFDVTAESSVPTWLSAILFLLSALMMLLIGRRVTSHGQARRWGWPVVSITLVALSVDEVASLHETSSRPLRRALGLDGIFYYAWLLPAVLLLVAAFLVLLPWLRRLPPRLRSWILLAAGVFLLGTLGFELVSSQLDSLGLQESTQYVVVSSIEESLELVGVGLLFSGLLSHLSREGDHFWLGFAGK